jgi:hypothetical protein
MIALIWFIKAFVDQGEWSVYLVPNKICKIILLFSVLYHWYVTFWLSNAALKYLHGFCYFLLFVFLPCWLVGFWIFKWRKIDKDITIAWLFINYMYMYWMKTSVLLQNGKIVMLVTIIKCNIFSKIKYSKHNIFRCTCNKHNSLFILHSCW